MMLVPAHVPGRCYVNRHACSRYSANTCFCGTRVLWPQEAKTTLARLCQHYSFELAPGQVRVQLCCAFNEIIL